MPRVVRRIVADAIAQAPARVGLAVGASLGAALASLALPRLLGGAVDLARGLGGAHPHADLARHALITAGLLVIVATAARGLFTMAAN